MDASTEKTAVEHHVDPEIPKPLADAIRRGSVPKDILEHSHDADEAMKALFGHEGEVFEIDEATNKRLVRRIDWHLMPVGSCVTCKPSCPKLLTQNADHVRRVWLELLG